MKPRLIILSDLFGFSNCVWIEKYVKHFSKSFEVQLYDSCELAEIYTVDQTQEVFHQKFVSEGIDKAVTKLLELEKGFVHVLAFSIGGTIAWKANLKGLKVRTLLAVSSTRLRKEFKRPTCNVKLIFGSDDEYIPSSEWFEKMQIEKDILEDRGHDVYKDSDFVKALTLDFDNLYFKPIEN